MTGDKILPLTGQQGGQKIHDQPLDPGDQLTISFLLMKLVLYWPFAFIFWYFLGAKLVGGSIIWIVLGSLLWHSFSIFHRLRRQIVSQEGKVKKYEYKKYEFSTKSAKTTSACAHVIAFILLSIVMLCVIL